MTRKILLAVSLCFLVKVVWSQSEKETRINLINPGIALEYPIGKNSTLEFNVGVGYNYSYPNLNTVFGESGFQWQIAPFIDIQRRKYYNFEKRQSNKKSGSNFIALRYLFYGSRLAGNVRTDQNYSMDIGPTWGMKREYGRWTALFSVGPAYYFDLTGAGGFLPIALEFNFGYRLK